jgi:hypothetical protein
VTVLPDFRDVNPAHDPAEWETYPTLEIALGALKIGVSRPAWLTVNAPDVGLQ